MRFRITWTIRGAGGETVAPNKPPEGEYEDLRACLRAIAKGMPKRRDPPSDLYEFVGIKVTEVPDA